jgi:NigD-like C-terminal beta sandwich domain
LRTDTVFIQEAKIAGEILNLEVSYMGGCKTHYFELLSDQLRDSEQCNLILSHNANGDACKKQVEEYISFDLSLIKDVYDSTSTKKVILIIGKFRLSYQMKE